MGTLKRSFVETHRDAIKAGDTDEEEGGYIHDHVVGAFRKQDNQRDAGG